MNVHECIHSTSTECLPSWSLKSTSRTFQSTVQWLTFVEQLHMALEAALSVSLACLIRSSSQPDDVGKVITLICREAHWPLWDDISSGVRSWTFAHVAPDQSLHFSVKKWVCISKLWDVIWKKTESRLMGGGRKTGGGIKIKWSRDVLSEEVMFNWMSNSWGLLLLLLLNRSGPSQSYPSTICRLILLVYPGHFPRIRPLPLFSLCKPSSSLMSVTWLVS